MRFIPAKFILASHELMQLNTLYDILEDIRDNCSDTSAGYDFDCLADNADECMTLLQKIIQSPCIKVEDE